MKENTYKKAQGRWNKPHRTGNKKKITYLSSKEMNNDRKGLNERENRSMEESERINWTKRIWRGRKGLPLTQKDISNILLWRKCAFLSMSVFILGEFCHPFVSLYFLVIIWRMFADVFHWTLHKWSSWIVKLLIELYM